MQPNETENRSTAMTNATLSFFFAFSLVCIFISFVTAMWHHLHLYVCMYILSVSFPCNFESKQLLICPPEFLSLNLCRFYMILFFGNLTRLMILLLLLLFDAVIMALVAHSVVACAFFHSTPFYWSSHPKEILTSKRSLFRFLHLKEKI